MKRQIQELARKAWERELNDYIHKYHNSDSRKIYKKYVHLKPDMSVTAAIACGILKKNEISEELWKLLEPRVNALKEINSKG